jgi:RHS repeat-associated protein
VAYDVENRVAEANGVKYAYSPDNLRMWRGSSSIDELTVYSMGQKLGAYNLSVNNGALVATCTGYYEYFGGKLLKNASGYVNVDGRGSIGKYFPYGQERPSATANGKEKFATYFRDAETGLDYAQNRYHSAGDGRFLTPDPYKASAGPEDPGSWNQYAYVGGDPINYADRSGLAREKADYCDIYPNDHICVPFSHYCVLYPEHCPSGSGATGEPPPDGGGSGGGYNSVGLAELARQWGLAALAKPGCAEALGMGGGAGAAILGNSNVTSIGFGSHTQTGDLQPLVTGKETLWATVQYFGSGAGATSVSIVFNEHIDWNTATALACDQNGQNCFRADLTQSAASRVGATSMTGGQFMTLTILHELAHVFGIHHPGGASDANGIAGENRLIWENCVKDMQ